MGNIDGVSGRGANAVKVGDELGANSGIGKVLFHHAELRLSAVLLPVKLNSLVLYHLEFALMRSISIDVSNNTGILEINDGIVDKESRSGGRVEDIEVIIFNPRAVEVGSRICTCVKGDGEFGITMLASPHKVSINPNLSKGDVTCYFVLPILIEEDKQVLLCITVVILAPPGSWVVWIVKLLSELRDVGDGTRCG